MGGLNKREHDYYYPKLTEEYGEVCLRCGNTPLAASNDANYCHRLLIHETKYLRPLDINFMCLLCDSCNQRMHPPKPIKTKRDKTPEMERADEKEPLAREYILHRIKFDGSADRRDLIASAAEKAKCSEKAVHSYLNKLTSTEGPLIEQLDIIYEKGKQPELKYDIELGQFIEVPKE